VQSFPVPLPVYALPSLSGNNKPLLRRVRIIWRKVGLGVYECPFMMTPAGRVGPGARVVSVPGVRRPKGGNRRRETGPCIPTRPEPPSASGFLPQFRHSRCRSPRCPGRPRTVGGRCAAIGRRRAFPESAAEERFIMASRGFQVHHARFTAASAPRAPTRKGQGGGEGILPRPPVLAYWTKVQLCLPGGGSESHETLPAR
jgi:hypothetical protein